MHLHLQLYVSCLSLRITLRHVTILFSAKIIFDKIIFDKIIFDKIIFDKIIFDKIIPDRVNRQMLSMSRHFTPGVSKSMQKYPKVDRPDNQAAV